MTSLAPNEAKWSAIALPIPREEPVTMATLSWSEKFWPWVDRASAMTEKH